ncbi:protein of unknown function [Thauera humireducens]|nr:protein of unknown function [Thauera humireducens]
MRCSCFRLFLRRLRLHRRSEVRRVGWWIRGPNCRSMFDIAICVTEGAEKVVISHYRGSMLEVAVV